MEHPALAFGVEGAVDAVAPEHFFRFLDDLCAFCFGALVVGVDVVDVHVDAGVEVGEVLGRADVHLLEGGGEHQGVAVHGEFGVADASVGHRHAHGFLEAEGAAEELDRGGRVFVVERGDDPLHALGRVLDHFAIPLRCPWR